jgi:tetratricopeptide (TPR) repeat protein
MRMSVRIRSYARVAIGIAIFSQIVYGQKTGGPPSSGPGSNAGANSRIPPNLAGRTDGPQQNTLNGSVYLTGTVMLDDGTPPPDPVTIERICGGAPRAQAYTDKKGRFSFQVGQTSGVMQDASEESSGMPGTNRPSSSVVGGIGPLQPAPLAPSMQMANCDLRAVLAGFRSDSVSLGTRRLLDDPNVGTIVLHRLANVEGSAVSMTSLQAPKDARRAYEKAIQDLRKDKPAEAGKNLQKAVDLYPNYAAAWYELGRMQQQNHDAGQARQSFTKAVAADSKFLSPYLKLAELQARAENWAQLADTTGKLLKLDAVDYPMAYYYNATANLNLRQLDAAEKSARSGEKLDTAHRYPRLEEVLAVVLARKKDYAGAVAHLRSYLALAPEAEDAARMRKELAELERLSGANAQAKAAKAQP